jgi:2,4-dienoyl-CoA reductase-like NADH-dependent reductase (Old Yellow Enzyme family)
MAMPSLFDPLKLGDLTLKNRIVMAPLTRARSGVERIPGPLVAEYYAQRASAGLIISEATSVTPLGVGYADTPGIWSEEQVEGWKLTTEAVHKAGGLIFCSSGTWDGFRTRASTAARRPWRPARFPPRAMSASCGRSGLIPYRAP